MSLLQLNPIDRVEFPRSRDGELTCGWLRLNNVHSTPVAYKIKSTAAKTYVIKPPSGSIKAGGYATIQIGRKPMEAALAQQAKGDAPQKADRFMVQATPADTQEKLLLLFVANQGNDNAKKKFWKEYGGEMMQEEKLEAVIVDGPAPRAPSPDEEDEGHGSLGGAGLGPESAAAQPAVAPPAASPQAVPLHMVKLQQYVDKGKGKGKSKGGQHAEKGSREGVTAYPKGFPTNRHVDDVIAKLSKPGAPCVKAAPKGDRGQGKGGSAKGGQCGAAVGPPGLAEGGGGAPGLANFGAPGTGGAPCLGGAPGAGGPPGLAAPLVPGPAIIYPQDERSKRKGGRNITRDQDVVLNGHSRPVTCVIFDRSGRTLFTCGKDKLVFAYSALDWRVLRQFDGHRGAVWGCAVSADGGLLLTCGADYAVLLWQVSSGQQIANVQVPGVARSVEWAPTQPDAVPAEDGVVQRRRFAVASMSFMKKPAALSVWELVLVSEAGVWRQTAERPKMLASILEPLLPSAATQVCWVGHWSNRLCSLHDSQVLFWDALSGAPLGRLEPHRGGVSMVGFPEDRALMVTCGRDTMEVKLWDVDAGAEGGDSGGTGPAAPAPEVLQTYVSDRALNCCAVRPSLTWREVVMGDEDEDAEKQCDVLVGGGQDARDVALVGSGGDDQFEPQALSLGSMQELEAFWPPRDPKDKRAGGHFGPINFVAFSPDGSLCASGSEDGNVRIRELYVD